jgi:hypothetical protein
MHSGMPLQFNRRTAMTKSTQRPVRVGDKVVRDTATVDQGKVHLGDWAPVFGPKKIQVGDKVIRDTATVDQGKVHLGDWAPVFGPKK